MSVSAAARPGSGAGTYATVQAVTRLIAAFHGQHRGGAVLSRPYISSPGIPDANGIVRIAASWTVTLPDGGAKDHAQQAATAHAITRDVLPDLCALPGLSQAGVMLITVNAPFQQRYPVKEGHRQ